jgi:hypothetical protein
MTTLPPVLQRVIRTGTDEQAVTAIRLYNDTWRRVFADEKQGAGTARLRATTAVVQYAKSVLL